MSGITLWAVRTLPMLRRRRRLPRLLHGLRPCASHAIGMLLLPDAKRC